MSDNSKVLGCLYGLAIGDALGAPIEFLSRKEITRKFGPNGLTCFEPWGGFPAGAISDDTQMSIATLRGLLSARVAGQLHAPTPYIYHEYLAWLATQSDQYHQRAPGHTCLSALRSGICGTIQAPINDSKGCGGVMRTAPIGLMCEPNNAFTIGVEAGAISHGHPSGYLPAGFIASLVAELVSGVRLGAAIDRCISRLQQRHGHEETLGKLWQALDLVCGDLPDHDCIHAIGGGWTGEEALAVAIFSALRHQRDYSAAVLSAVNHSGDSDSTGSIAGAIVGTVLGIDAISKRWVAQIEGAAQLKPLAFAVAVGGTGLTTTASRVGGSVTEGFSFVS